MRVAARALIVVLVITGCRELLAAESNSSWWPFGHHNDAALTQPQAVAANSSSLAAAQQPTTGPIAHQVQLPTSPDAAAAAKKKSSWLHLPKLTSSEKKTKAESTRNAWAAKPAAKTSSSPLKPVTDGAHKVTEGTKAAWHKTVTALTPGGKSKPQPAPSPQVANREAQPSFWKRMTGSKQPATQQAQTVPQWMAQKRLDP